jgi:methylenetetrahydrofolate reductase (NADPH)
MIKVSQPERAAAAVAGVPAAADLKARIVSFMHGASTEITPSEEDRLPELKSILPAGSTVYVAHTPHATFAQVIHAALEVRRAGFLAAPHIAVRRVPDFRTLRAALADLHAGGVDRILLIAGDAPRPVGEFSATLDVLESGIVGEAGITRIGVAGHPEGHDAMPRELLWNVLAAKQAYAERAGLNMHIVTQFGLSPNAMKVWDRELVRRRIALPVRVGIAGPAPIGKLLHFAIQCGIGASMRAVMHNLGASFRAADLATSPDQHLLALLQTPDPTRIVAPHFFAFGGALETARWMRTIAAGEFEIDLESARFNPAYEG